MAGKLRVNSKYVKVALSFVLSLTFIFACASIASAEITVRVNGQAIYFDQPPQNIEGRILVPVRAIFDALGAGVVWQQETGTVIATRSGTTVTLQVGNQQALKNTDKIFLDVPPQNIGGRVLVPLRFVSDAFGAYVSWDGEHSTVRISNRAENLPTGSPAAQGNYDPSTGLTLKTKLNNKADLEVILEPGALVKAAPVALYTSTARAFRLIAGADVVTQNLPGKNGFEGARIKVIYTEKWPFELKRPMILGNNEMISNRCWIGQDIIRAGAQVVERDTDLNVIEANESQWANTEVIY
jgi:hypothetical protein